jgi:hypothetical protein
MLVSQLLMRIECFGSGPGFNGLPASGACASNGACIHNAYGFAGRTSALSMVRAKQTRTSS